MAFFRTSRDYTLYNSNTKTSMIGKELGVKSVAFNIINFGGGDNTTDNDGEDVCNIVKGSFFIDPNQVGGGVSSYTILSTLFKFPTTMEESLSTTKQANACLRLKLVISDFSGNNLTEQSQITKSALYTIVASSPSNTSNPPYYNYSINTPTTDVNDQFNTVSPIDPPGLEFVDSPNFISWDNTNKRFLMRLILNQLNEHHLIRGIYTIM